MTTQVKEPITAAAAPAAEPVVADTAAAAAAAMEPEVAVAAPAVADAAAAKAAKLTRERRKFTVAEYYRMGEVGILHPTERVELLDGAIIVMAPIGIPHAAGVRRMERVLHQTLGAAASISVQNPILLGDYSEPEPDLAILRRREDDYADAHPGPADVLVAVEVADSSLVFDREMKSRRYAAAGIPEMWIMNLPGDCIDRLDQPTPAGYARHTIFKRGDKIRPAAFPDLAWAVEDLLPPRPAMRGTAG